MKKEKKQDKPFLKKEKKDSKKDKPKETNNGDKARNIYRQFLIFIQKRNWIFTIAAFLAVFVLALFIWNRYVFSEKPEKEIVSEFQLKEEQINQKMEKIERVISSLNQRKERFESVPDFPSAEEVFQLEEEFEASQGANDEAVQLTQ